MHLIFGVGWCGQGLRRLLTCLPQHAWQYWPLPLFTGMSRLGSMFACNPSMALPCLTRTLHFGAGWCVQGLLYHACQIALLPLFAGVGMLGACNPHMPLPCLTRTLQFWAGWCGQGIIYYECQIEPLSLFTGVSSAHVTAMSDTRKHFILGLVGVVRTSDRPNTNIPCMPN